MKKFIKEAILESLNEADVKPLDKDVSEIPEVILNNLLSGLENVVVAFEEGSSKEGFKLGFTKKLTTKEISKMEKAFGTSNNDANVEHEGQYKEGSKVIHVYAIG